jgi:hypothetical protein
VAHTSGNVVVHLIFSTKGRRPLITPEIRSDLFAYLGGNVSESKVPAVSRYIAAQEGHHRTRSFQQEFATFLQKNKIRYDERYIWD